MKSEITALIQIRLLTDFLCSQKHSKVSFELPEGFSVTAEKWQQQGMRLSQNRVEMASFVSSPIEVIWIFLKKEAYKLTFENF
ncbi:hypothetical protein MUN53_13955, partial [Parabacteroides sp. AGMB00274]